MRWIIIGNPESRRVRLFQQALARQGIAPGLVLRWLDLAQGAEAVLAALPEEPALLRIDSFERDFEVERQLLARGYEVVAASEPRAWVASPAEVAALAYDRGRIFAPRQHHCGFLEVLGDVARALGRRRWLRVLNAPESIARLFDKRGCVSTFQAAGVPIPRPVGGAPETPDALRDAMRDAGIARVFVKLSCGSAASCLALYESGPPSWLFTSMEIDGTRLYNSRRMRRYRDRAAIDRLLGFLLREGSHVEEHVPKAAVGGSFFDTRMVTIAGEVAFTVMRKSRHPITNLHLGGTRGAAGELEASIDARTLRAAHDSCRRVAGAYDSLHLGIDVMFTATRDGHRVLEANAFGDLLPNVERDGLSVYEWQIRAAGA